MSEATAEVSPPAADIPAPRRELVQGCKHLVTSSAQAGLCIAAFQAAKPEDAASDDEQDDMDEDTPKVDKEALIRTYLGLRDTLNGVGDKDAADRYQAKVDELQKPDPGTQIAPLSAANAAGLKALLMKYKEDRTAKLEAKAKDIETAIAELLQQQDHIKAQQARVTEYATSHLQLLAEYEKTFSVASATVPHVVTGCHESTNGGPTLLQAVAGQMAVNLDTLKIDPAKFANTLEQKSPQLAKLAREADPSLMQEVARFAAGYFCTLTVDHINGIEAQHTKLPQTTEEPEPTPQRPTAAKADSSSSSPVEEPVMKAARQD